MKTLILFLTLLLVFTAFGCSAQASSARGGPEKSFIFNDSFAQNAQTGISNETVYVRSETAAYLTEDASPNQVHRIDAGNYDKLISVGRLNRVNISSVNSLQITELIFKESPPERAGTSTYKLPPLETFKGFGSNLNPRGQV